MGYTHYYTMKGHITEKDHNNIRREFEGLIPLFLTQYNTQLAGWDGEGEATINDNEIRFNGLAENDQGHETMSLGINTDGFNFCKTVRKPYDIAVTSLLIIAKHYLGDNIEVSSDGDIEDWSDAMSLVQESYGYGQEFDLDD